jgi:hypothetical protein
MATCCATRSVGFSLRFSSPAALRYYRPAILLCAGLVLLASGCGSSLPGVTGTVKVGSAPLTTGTMTFHPEKKGPLGYATVQSDGSFTARTGDEEGLMAGKYKVTVSAFEPLPPATKDVPVPAAKRLVAARYADVATTSESIEVKEDGENTFDLVLKNE